MLGDQEAWPVSSSLNYNTILQLDLFCKRQKSCKKFSMYRPLFSFTKASETAVGCAKPILTLNHLEIFKTQTY